MTNEQKLAIEAMTDAQVLRLLKILRLTKAVHDITEEDRFVAEEARRRTGGGVPREK